MGALLRPCIAKAMTPSQETEPHSPSCIQWTAFPRCLPWLAFCVTSQLGNRARCLAGTKAYAVRRIVEATWPTFRCSSAVRRMYPFTHALHSEVS
jgi:hypothetical protein